MNIQKIVNKKKINLSMKNSTSIDDLNSINFLHRILKSRDPLPKRLRNEKDNLVLVLYDLAYELENDSSLDQEIYDIIYNSNSDEALHYDILLLLSRIRQTRKARGSAGLSLNYMREVIKRDTKFSSVSNTEDVVPLDAMSTLFASSSSGRVGAGKNPKFIDEMAKNNMKFNL